MLSILLSKDAKVGKGGVVFELGLYCFKINFSLGLHYILNGMRFYSRVGLYLRGYGMHVGLCIRSFLNFRSLESY